MPYFWQSGRTSRSMLRLSYPSRRIEVFPTCVHLLLDQTAALENGPRGAAGLRAIEENLRVGESVSLEEKDLIRIIVVRRLRFIGGKTWLTDPTSGAITSHGSADLAIGKALKSAHAKLGERGVGPHSSSERLRTAKGAGNPHLRLISRLAFLAPDIQEAILDGRIPRHWNILGLTQPEIPLAWADQRSYLGISAASD